MTSIPRTAAPEGAVRYEGTCHCGAIGYSYFTRIEPGQWPIRACQCSFCRAHGARTTSDPAGWVELALRKGARRLRYRFAQRTADYLICGECGVYTGAVIETGQGCFAIVNVNALNPRLEGLAPSQAMVYDAETAEQRLQRRVARWTPCGPGSSRRE